MDLKDLRKPKGPKGPGSERKHGLSTEQVPVFAYVGSAKDLKDLKRLLNSAPYLHYHTVEYAVFVASKFRGLLDQICTA